MAEFFSIVDDTLVFRVGQLPIDLHLLFSFARFRDTLEKSLLLVARPALAVFMVLVISWVDFQNGLFFGVLGERPSSARAALIIAASALLASSSKVLASAFSPVGFFWAVFATAASV